MIKGLTDQAAEQDDLAMGMVSRSLFLPLFEKEERRERENNPWTPSSFIIVFPLRALC